MNKSSVSRILNEERAKEFYRLLSKNEFITECIIEIIDNKLISLSKASPIDDLTESGWALKRAYRDGGKYNLESLKQIFKELVK